MGHGNRSPKPEFRGTLRLPDGEHVDPARFENEIRTKLQGVLNRETARVT
jgi:hypothetical protein